MASLLSYALTDLASVKETLGIASGNTSKDNLIIRKINQATDVIEGFCALAQGHHFKETTYTNEEYTGSGSNQLVLKMRPVSTVSSFQSRSTTTNDDDWDSVETELYFLDEDAGIIDLLFHQSSHWNIYRVSYTAGFSTIPADLAEACVILASYLVDNASSGSSVKRKKEGSREIEYFAPTQGDSLIEQLSIDDMIGKYVNTEV